MNLAVRASTANDRHHDLKADFILANPAFDDYAWRGTTLLEDLL
jgi:hypothetical protein